MRALMGAALLLAVLAGTAAARSVTRGVTDVTVISDGEGASRVLFKLDSGVALGDVAVRRATLSFRTAARAESEVVRLRVYPVTAQWTAGAAGWTSWSSAGGDIDDEVYAKADVTLGGAGSTVRLDVTDLVREIVLGTADNGFLLTVDPSEGAGISAADIDALSSLTGGTLEVEYRKLPRARPAPAGTALGG
jgi:hypothetical protein